MKKGLLAFLLFIGPALAQTEIGIVEKVILYTPAAEYELEATIDTGADSSSIDIELAQSLGLEPNENKIIITDARGREERNTINLHFTLADSDIFTVGTVSNRSELSTKMLIGTKDLHPFSINPAATFLTIPQSSGGQVWGRLAHILEREYIRLVLAIPILSVFILLLRHIIGIQTYGVFGPLIIAISIHQIGLFEGLMTFIMLIGIGIGVKQLLAEFTLPLITELSVLLFVLALGTVTLTLLFSSSVLLKVIFPMIITSFLVERFSQQLELHETGHAIRTMVSTLAASFFLALLITPLVQASTLVLVFCFTASLLLGIIISNYVGLRLTEVFRFKLLGEK